MAESEGEIERLLVLVVDRDGDLTAKTGIRTPLYGKEAVREAAAQLAISDPEEADANAMFAAIKEFDRVTRQEVDCAVGVVCGNNEGGVSADRKIRREVETLLKREAFTGIVLVSDGIEDEQVIPVIQSLKPISSVVRIVVKHSRTVEETYLVLGRYLRMLVFDPRYSKWAIGVPGVIILLAGVLVALNRTFEAEIATLLIVGTTFFVRGFNIDRTIAEAVTPRPYGYVRLFSVFACILVMLVGISNGFSYMTQLANNEAIAIVNNPAQFYSYLPSLAGYFLKGSIPFLWAGMGVYFVGTLLTHIARGSVRAWRDGVLLVVLGLLYFPMDTFSTFLIGGERSSSILLITYVLLGMAAIFTVVTTFYRRARPTTQAIST